MEKANPGSGQSVDASAKPPIEDMPQGVDTVEPETPDEGISEDEPAEEELEEVEVVPKAASRWNFRRGPVRETKDGLVRDCPNCKKDVRLGASRRPHCRIYLDDRYAHIDEGSFRFARLVVLESMKEEIRHWFHNTVIKTSVGFLLIVALVGLGGHRILRDLLSEEAKTRLARPSAPPSQKRPRSSGSDGGSRFASGRGGAQGAGDRDVQSSLERKGEGSWSSPQAAMTDFVRVDARLDDLAATVARFDPKLASDRYHPVLTRPFSRFGPDAHAVLYRNPDKPSTCSGTSRPRSMAGSGTPTASSGVRIRRFGPTRNSR